MSSQPPTFTTGGPNAPTFTTGSPQPPADPLALDRAKGLTELLRDTWVLWWKHAGVFLMTAALVVIPVEVVVTGLLGGGFNDPYGSADSWAQILSLSILSLVTTALVTAIHSRAVVELARGEALTTADAFSLGLKGFGAVFLATLAYGLGFAFGLLLLLVPGLFLSVAGVFTAQVAALHGTGPVESVKASVRVVRGSGWWRTFGYLLVLTLAASMIVGVGGVALMGVSFATGEHDGFGAIAVPVTALLQAVATSWTALASALLYFSWRADQGDPFVEGGPAPQGRLVPREPVCTDGPVAPGGPTFTKR